MDQLEIGLYSAFAAYVVIAIWTVLARLHWLPVTLARSVDRALAVPGRIPMLGRVVTFCRRHPLSAGLVPAVLVGFVVPSLVVSALWVAYLLSFCIAFFLAGAALRASSDEEVSDEPDPYGMYQEKHGDGLVRGTSPYADVDRRIG